MKLIPGTNEEGIATFSAEPDKADAWGLTAKITGTCEFLPADDALGIPNSSTCTIINLHFAGSQTAKAIHDRFKKAGLAPTSFEESDRSVRFIYHDMKSLAQAWAQMRKAEIGGKRLFTLPEQDEHRLMRHCRDISHLPAAFPQATFGGTETRESVIHTSAFKGIRTRVLNLQGGVLVRPKGDGSQEL